MKISNKSLRELIYFAKKLSKNEQTP